MKERISKIWIGIKFILKKVLLFFKVYNVYAVLAIAFWYAPSWLAFFIPSLESFALTWLGLLTSPIIPVVIVVPLTAVLFRWMHKKINQLVVYIKGLVKKYGYSQLALTYFTVDEFLLIIEKGKVMKDIKDHDTKVFKDNQSSKRIKMMTDDWETKLEEK